MRQPLGRVRGRRRIEHVRLQADILRETAELESERGERARARLEIETDLGDVGVGEERRQRRAHGDRLVAAGDRDRHSDASSMAETDTGRRVTARGESDPLRGARRPDQLGDLVDARGDARSDRNRTRRDQRAQKALELELAAELEERLTVGCVEPQCVEIEIDREVGSDRRESE